MGAQHEAGKAITVVVLLFLVRQVDHAVARRVAQHALGVMPLLHAFDFALEHSAVQGHAFVRGAQLFSRAVGNRALGDPGHHVLAVNVVHDVFAVLVFERHIVGVYGFKQLRRHGGPLRRQVGVVPKVQGVGVVHRHPHLKRVVARLGVAIAHRQNVGEQNRVSNAPIVRIFRVAFEQAVLGDAEFELAKVDFFMARADRHFHAFLLFLEFVLVAMQPLGVHRVQRVFHDLQPVHGQERAAHDADRAFGHETIKLRQHRRRQWSHVGKQHATQLLHRVGGGADEVAKGLVVGLEGLV